MKLSPNGRQNHLLSTHTLSLSVSPEMDQYSEAIRRIIMARWNVGMCFSGCCISGGTTCVLETKCSSLNFSVVCFSQKGSGTGL